MNLFFSLLLWQVFTTNPVDPRFGVAGAAITHDRAFGMPELTELTATAAWNLFKIPVEIGVSSFGFSLYRESRIRGGVGFTHGDLRAGAILETRVFSPRGFIPIRRHSVSANARFPLTDDILAGVILENLNAAADIPQVFATAIVFSAHPNVKIEAGVWKDVTFPADGRLRLRWAPHPALEITFGRHTDPAQWNASVVIRTTSAHVGFHFRNHPVLGWSHSQELIWLW